MANGTKFYFDRVDGRSIRARRFRDIYTQTTEDLGGLDRLSEGETQIVRGIAMLSVMREDLDIAYMKGAPELTLDSFAATYGLVINTLLKCFRSVGLKRRPREVSGELEEYVKAKGAEEPRSEE